MTNTARDIAVDYIYDRLVDGVMNMKDVIMTGFKGLDHMDDDEILEWYVELKKDEPDVFAQGDNSNYDRRVKKQTIINTNHWE